MYTLCIPPSLLLSHYIKYFFIFELHVRLIVTCIHPCMYILCQFVGHQCNEDRKLPKTLTGLRKQWHKYMYMYHPTARNQHDSKSQTTVLLLVMYSVMFGKYPTFENYPFAGQNVEIA